MMLSLVEFGPLFSSAILHSSKIAERQAQLHAESQLSECTPFLLLVSCLDVCHYLVLQFSPLLASAFFRPLCLASSLLLYLRG